MLQARAVMILAVFSIGLAQLSAPMPARGEAADSLNRVRRLVDSFEFEAAIEELQLVIDSGAVTAPQRIEALELMSVLQFNLDRLQQAQQTYERLLALDPGHEPRDTSYAPRLLEFFTEVQRSFIPQVTIRVEARAFQPAADGATRVEATVAEEHGGIDRLLAMVRYGSSGDFRRAIMQQDGDLWLAELPSSEDASQLEYYIEVQAPSGYVVGRAGSEDAPLGLSDESASSAGTPGVTHGEGGSGEVSGTGRPIYRRWWFWTIIGAVVVGGATTAVVLTLPEDQLSGTLGTRSLP